MVEPCRPFYDMKLVCIATSKRRFIWSVGTPLFQRLRKHRGVSRGRWLVGFHERFSYAPKMLLPPLSAKRSPAVALELYTMLATRNNSEMAMFSYKRVQLGGKSHLLLLRPSDQCRRISRFQQISYCVYIRMIETW